MNNKELFYPNTNVQKPINQLATIKPMIKNTFLYLFSNIFNKYNFTLYFLVYAQLNEMVNKDECNYYIYALLLYVFALALLKFKIEYEDYTKNCELDNRD